MNRHVGPKGLRLLAIGLALLTANVAAAHTNIDYSAHVAFGAPVWRAVAYAGGYTLAGFNKTLVVFKSPQPESLSVAALAEFNGSVRDIFYTGGRYAYVAATSDGLAVLDMNDPTAPTRVGAAAVGGNARSVTVVGIYAYVGDYTGFYVVDISTPTAPAVRGSIAGIDAEDVVASGTYVYVAAAGGGVKVVDVSTPTAPVVKASMPIAGNATGLALSGSTLYAALSGGGVALYNVANPLAPTLVSSITTTGYAYDVLISGTKLYVGAYNLVVVDVSDTANLKVLGQVYLNWSVTGLCLAGGKVDAVGGAGLSVVDVSKPAAPVRSAFYPAAELVNDMALDGDTAALSVGGNGIVFLDVASPRHATVRGAFFPGGNVGRLAMQNGYVYVLGGPLSVIDATTTTPAVVGQYNGMSSPADVAVAGNYAYLVNNSASVDIVDISTPSAPKKVATATTRDTANHVQVYGDRVFLGGADAFQILDVGAPAAPVVRGLYPMPHAVKDIAVAGDVAYVVDDAAGLTVLDVRNPDAPTWAGQDTAPRTSYSIALSSRRAYIGATSGLYVDDLQDPYAPAQIGVFSTTTNGVMGIGVADGYAVAATWSDGVYVVHNTGECFDPFERNNEQASAWPLPFSAVRQPMICDTADVDWFKVTAPSGGTIQATMAPPTGANYDLFLYDAAGNMAAASVAADDAVESVSRTTAQGGDWYLKVVGSGLSYSATSPYTLYATFAACVAPTQPVYVYGSVRDANNNVTLNVQDPNQPTSVGGYNIYRAAAPQGPWTLLAANVVDMDKSLANVQFTDVGSNDGATYFYRVTAVNAACGGEGP